MHFVSKFILSAFIILFSQLFFLQNIHAKEFAIFDGRTYNGKYYPRVDIIEWGEPPHLEFHIYSKDEPIDIQAKAIVRGGNRVLLVNYFFTKRKEKVCRSVIAPANFSPDQTIYFYKDASDNEYDNIYISMSPITTTRNIASYAEKQFDLNDCDEDEDDEKKSANNSQTNRNVASVNSSNATNEKQNNGAVKPVEGMKVPVKKHELIDYDNNALPYNF